MNSFLFYVIIFIGKRKLYMEININFFISMFLLLLLIFFFNLFSLIIEFAMLHWLAGCEKIKFILGRN